MTKYLVKSVPSAARVLLDFLSWPESKGDYEAWSSYKQRNLPKRLTDMTLAEVLECQRNWRSIGGISSAAGRYQIIRKTLEMLISKLGLSLDMKFDARLQDYLGYQLLRGRGYDRWIAGEINDITFGNNLAKEWASLPVLSNIKNYKGQWISAGTSYYAGDGLNSHGASAAQVIAALKSAKSEPAAVVVEELPKPKVKDVAKPVIAIGAAAATAGGSVVAGVDTVVGMYVQYRPFIEMLWADYGMNGVYALAAGVAAFFAVKYLPKLFK